MKERLQKILSARGICSRRKAEEYLDRGLVKVNGMVAKVGDKADPSIDRIEVDGKVLEERQEMFYYLMNKPVGVVTSNVEGNQSDQGNQRNQRFFLLRTSKRPAHLHVMVSSSNHTCKGAGLRMAQKKSIPTVRDLLPRHLQGKIYPVGRLDKETSGLLLLTNDGVLAYRLTHPKFDHEKEYEVVTEHPIADGALHKLGKGITIDGTKTKPAKVRRISPSSFRIALTEGRNRQIRRMCQKVGSPVRDLRRVRIMTIDDRALKPGKIRELQKKEVEGLLKAVGLHP